jgi:hypothetical protein
MNALDKTLLDKYISEEDAVAAVATLAPEVGDSQVRQWLCEKAVAAYKKRDGYLTRSSLGILGPVLDKCVDWNAVNKSDLCGLLEPIASVYGSQANLQEYRRFYGFDNSYPDFDRTPGKKAAIQALLEASGDVCDPTASRKRRSTATLTCTQVKSLKHVLEMLDPAEFSNMDNTEFKDCADVIGRVGNFSAEQWAKIAEKAIAVYGNPDTWSDEDAFYLAGVVSGLTPVLIASLKLTDMSVISEMGKFGLWMDTDKLKAFANEVVKQYRSDNSSSVTSIDLRTFGHFPCGLETGKIAQLSSEAVCESVVAIGGLSSCTPQQMQAYITHLKKAECFGTTPSGWDSIKISKLGHLIGGLTKADLSSLTSAQLQDVEPSSIAKVPPMNVNGLTKAHLESMTPLQLGSLTQEQFASLDPEKQQAVLDKIEYLKDELGDPSKPKDDKKSSCGFLEASGLIVVTTLLAALLRI